MKLIALVLLILVPFGFAQQFSHVVIVVQENRTPDNLFGSNPSFEPGVDIATSGLNSKNQVTHFSPVALAGCYDLGHSHASFVSDYAGGKMNGFNIGQQKPCGGAAPSAYRYVDNSTGTVQPYFDLATQYGFANRMFQTNQGPSFPAHQFLLSGTSAPDDASNLFASENVIKGSGPINGCASAPGTYVNLIDPMGKITTTFPCFDRSTLIDRIEGAGLTWKYYSTNATWNAPQAISKLCQVVQGKYSCTGTEWKNDKTPATVLTDVATCKLASVVWVTPTAANSDHASDNKAGGPSWVASIVNAIGTSKCGYWQNTAILITWDDWGGWYDHVPPPASQSNGWGVSYVYGFRVPLLVVSAYTPAGYVSNVTHDFGSMLRFTEDNFNLGLIGPGNFADSYADDLSDFFTLSTPRTFVQIKAAYGPEHFINDTDTGDPDND